MYSVEFGIPFTVYSELGTVYNVEVGSRGKKAHIQALVCAPEHVCALVCAPKLVCALVCVLVGAPKLVCELVCAPKLVCAAKKN